MQIRVWVMQRHGCGSISPTLVSARISEDKAQSRKSKGGGFTVIVNIRWCNPGHATVKHHFCSLDIEVLDVSFCPYYLQREFTSVSGSSRLTISWTLHDIIIPAIAKLQTQPSSFLDITGDFNHVSLFTTFPTFQQYVNRSTRENKMLDLFYANVRDAYSYSARPALGKPDHNLIYRTYKCPEATCDQKDCEEVVTGS